MSSRYKRERLWMRGRLGSGREIRGGEGFGCGRTLVQLTRDSGWMGGRREACGG